MRYARLGMVSVAKNPLRQTSDWREVPHRGNSSRLCRTTTGKIRQLVLKWMSATKAGDVEKVLSLMSDDV